MSNEPNLVNFTCHGIKVDINEIKQLIPHRYPFLLIDKVEQVIIDQSAVGVKNNSINEWYFQGHFPDYPVMPGVMIVEALAQTAAVLVMKTLIAQNSGDKPGNVVYFMSIEDAKFRKPVVPGDVLALKVVKIQARGNVWKFKGEAFVKDVLVSEATFTAMITNPS